MNKAKLDICALALLSTLTATPSIAQDAAQQQQPQIDQQQMRIDQQQMYLQRPPVSPVEVRQQQLKHQELLLRQGELSAAPATPQQQQQLDGQRMQLQQQQLMLQQRQRESVHRRY